MKKLSDFERLEDTGVWRESMNDPGHSVIVQLSEFELIIINKENEPLARWTLDAVRHLNPGTVPAIFSPDEQADETIEISDPFVIDILSHQLNPKQNQPEDEDDDSKEQFDVKRRLIFGTLVITSFLLSIFLFSGQITAGFTRLIPASEQLEIGEITFGHLVEQVGERCKTFAGNRALSKLANKLFGMAAPTIRIVRSDIYLVTYLPGEILVLSDTVFNNQEQLSIIAGNMFNTKLLAVNSNPIERLLQESGLWRATLYILRRNPDDLRIEDFASSIQVKINDEVDDQAILELFRNAGLPSWDYAISIGSTGQLLTNSPSVGISSQRIVGDHEWKAIKNICLN